MATKLKPPPKSAVEALQRQQGLLVDPSDLPVSAEDLDLTDFLLDTVRKKGLSVDVHKNIISGSITRTMDGSSNIAIVVSDHDNQLLKSGIFGDGTEKTFPAIDVNLDGLWFRLVQVNKSGDQINLTFEDRVTAYLRLHNTPRKMSRANHTRAQFVHSMITEVKAAKINFISPEENITQPRAEVFKNTTSQKPGYSPSGFDPKAHLTIKGVRADDDQLSSVGRSLDVADALHAGPRATLSMIVAGIGESSFRKSAKDFATGTHQGVYQSNQIPPADVEAQAHHFLVGGKSFIAGGAIGLASAHPEYSVGTIAALVEGSGTNGSFYDVHHDEAKALIEAYTNKRSSTGGNVNRTYIKGYEFHRGPPDGPKGENTWDCSGRLAEEVRWRRFVVGNSFYFVPDRDLMAQRPVDTINEDDHGIDTIDFDIDQGKPVSEATVKCRASRWFAHPGQVIEIDEMGTANGMWLVWTIERDLFSTDCTITLRQPESDKKEPAPEVAGRPGGGGLPGATGDKTSQAGVTAAGYTLPLDQEYMRGPQDLGRTDDGVDVETAPDGAAVYSMTDGEVTAVASDPGGFGPNYPVIKVSHGPEKDRCIYYGHVARALVNVGQKVKAGDKIAIMGHTGDAAGIGHGHIEVGFGTATGAPLNSHHNPSDLDTRYGGAATHEGVKMRKLLIAIMRGVGPTPGRDSYAPGGGART